MITEEKDTSFYPMATLESAGIATERLYYSGVDTGRVNKNTVPGYPADATTSPNDYIQQLSGSGFTVGSGIVLKVMAGDRFNVRASSWYKKNGATPGTPVSIITSLVNALVSDIGGITATHGGTTPGQLQSSGVFIPGVTDFLNNRSYTGGKPKAYLNWVFFDDQFKMVTGSSGVQQVGEDNTFTQMVQNGITAGKNGYLYVYVSNETPNINVFFDNLQVTHIHGPLLQEQSYYPFGLEMAGISDKALGKLDSKNKFNGGVEIEEDYGVNLYSTFYRQYDPQTGRFGGVDAMAERMAGLSPYQFGNNNPVSYNDPLGLLAQYGGMPKRYIDANGNIWHTPGVLHGIQGLENMPFSFEDEFHFFLDNNFGGEGGGPGEISSVKAGYSDGQAGFWVSWSLQGEAAHGNTLEEVRIARAFVPYNYGESNGSKWLEFSIHANDGFGGLGTGLGYSSASFRLTNGISNGSDFSFKYYSSGWKGGSRARISTYEVAGFGEGLAKGSIVAGVVLGGISVYEGIEKDGGTYGTNAQLATGNAVGGLVGGWAGAETGAAIGASFGSVFGGVGAVPGAIIGGIIGGIWGGIFGSEAGEDVVKKMQ